MSFFNSLVQRVGYGAIMYNVSTGTTLSSCYPFFTSQSDLSKLKSTSSSGAGTISINDVDNYFTVMPGYKIIVYPDSAYGGSVLLTGDNTSGTVPVNYSISPADQASSIKLYFNNTLIEDPSLIVTLFNGSAVTVSNYSTTYDISYGSTYYHVYEFYTGSTGSLSFTGSSNVSNIQCLLIGGGGGGGIYSTGSNGSGGGGAGTFVYATFTAPPGATYTVNVGAGGAGGAAGTNTAGSAGSPSSITRSYNYVVDASLNAGGGGSGGGANVPKGNTAVTNYGSTGGGCGTTSTTAGTKLWGTFTTDSILSYANVGGTGVATGGGGGGGGANAAGGNGIASSNGGVGGAGKAWTVIPARTFAGGGGGMNAVGGSAGGGGAGGGGAGYASATANTGSGGGSGYNTTAGGSGGSGICIILIPV